MRKNQFLLVIVFLFSLTGCSSISQPEPTPTVTPKPIATPKPTLSLEEKYCENYELLKADLITFGNSVIDFSDFLESDSPLSMTVGEWINLMFRAGPIVSSYTREGPDDEVKKEYLQIIEKTRKIEETGIKVQIAFSRVEVPSSLKYSQEKMMKCFENAITTATSMANYFEFDDLFYDLPGFQECAQLHQYTDEIINFCKD